LTLFVSAFARAETPAPSSKAVPDPVERMRQKLVIPRFDDRVDFGCDLNRPPWNTAARTTGLLELNSRQLSKVPTFVYACYDASALWLAFRCEGIDGRTAKTEASERDGRVWWDDCVEFYCSPNHSRHFFLQLAANAAGVAYDGNETNGGEWNADWQVASASDERGFTVVMRVPFDELGVRSPEPGDTWAVNFSRHGPKSGSSSWVWAYNGLHDPRQYGKLVFGGPRVKPARLKALQPWGMGTNVVKLEDAAGKLCRFIGRDENGQTILEERVSPVSDEFRLALTNDRIRSVEARIEDKGGQVLARLWSDVATPEVTPRLADWTQRLQVMDRVIPRFPANAQPRVRDQVEQGKELMAKAKRFADAPAIHSPETWHEVAAILDTLDKTLGDLSCYARTLEHFPRASFAVGFESSMRQVMIRDFPFQGWFDRQVSVSLAANEHEAFQLVVIPFDRDLKNVRVAATLSAPAGSPGDLSCSVSLVGHVDVNDDPPYESSYKGFWPDVLLSFLRTADIKAGEHVAFWIDVAAGKKTPAGRYQGQVRVTADDCEPIEIPLAVRVWNFELPDGTHLRNAFTFHENPIRNFYPGDPNKPDQQDERKDEIIRAYQDLVLDHRLGIDHLYRRHPPKLETLQRAVARGMNAFNVVFAGSGAMKQHVTDALQQFVPLIREAGLFDLAYLYGFDEIKKDKFNDAREVFEEVHRLSPGLPTMTTAQDPSFGKETGLREAVDIWVPLTSAYDVVAADELRREGKQMWWYICLVPVHPYANWFIEYPVIESRLLMGAMSHKYQVDGFLYYLINNGWERNKQVISHGPYTDWDPASCENSKKKWANGDGNLIYPGPDGPLASLRLANIRDGLEDYEYLYLLRRCVEQIGKLAPTPARREFLESARALLAVPDSVVRNLVEYTYRPENVVQWRAAMAELIVKSKALGSNEN